MTQMEEHPDDSAERHADEDVTAPKERALPAIDVGALADRVYRLMREELRLETARGARRNI